jgi:plastocyanin
MRLSARLLLLALIVGPTLSARRLVATKHTVRMQGGRFAPYELLVNPGDTIHFVLGSGGPHNVAFRETKGDAAIRLRARMGKDTIADLASPLLILPGDTYDIVFDVPTGKYPYWCIPHLAMGQMGSITVK